MLEIALAWLPRLMTAAVFTIGLSAVIFAISGVTGLVLAVLARDERSVWRRRAVETFSGAFRLLPELIVLFFIFFGSAQLGFALAPIPATIIAFALVGIAYDYQVFKGALAVIAPGQFEAGRALGLREWQIYLRIVFPQMLPVARKGWITYAIGTVKRVSIASAISVSEILYVTKQAIAATNAPFVFLSIAVTLYCLIVAPLLIFNEWPTRRRA